MNKVYLLLGSNLGNKAQNLQKTMEHIEKRIGPVTAQSSVYQTAPWGFVHEEIFLNQCLLVETHLNPQEVLEQILGIERLIGRYRSKKQWEARIIDIDILFFGNVVVEEENLQIPHPYLSERRFALTPLNEIAAHVIHPKLQVSVQELLDKCADPLLVQRVV